MERLERSKPSMPIMTNPVQIRKAKPLPANKKVGQPIKPNRIIPTNKPRSCPDNSNSKNTIPMITKIIASTTKVVKNSRNHPF